MFHVRMCSANMRPGLPRIAQESAQNTSLSSVHVRQTHYHIWYTVVEFPELYVGQGQGV